MKSDKKPIHTGTGSQETIIIGAGSGGAPASTETMLSIGAGSGGAPAGITKM